MGLVNQVEGLDKAIVEKFIYAIEDDMVKELCGEEYERTMYQRHDHKNRTLNTSIGTLELSLRRVRDKETGDIFSPVAETLKFPEVKRICEDVSLDGIEQILNLSYRKYVKTVKELVALGS